MDKPFNYIAEANVTASNKFHGEKVPLHHFQAILLASIEIGKRLDAIKKSIFYGRDFPPAESYGVSFMDCNALPPRLEGIDPHKAELIIHSILGKATESVELLELLNNVLFMGSQFDEINFVEEIGDGQWYDAIGLAAVDFTFDECQRRNIAKLRARFPDKFTEYDANNRDLFAERKILEGAAVSPPSLKAVASDAVGEMIEG